MASRAMRSFPQKGNRTRVSSPSFRSPLNKTIEAYSHEWRARTSPILNVRAHLVIDSIADAICSAMSK